MAFQKLGEYIFGVPDGKDIVFWGLYCGFPPPLQGNHHLGRNVDCSSFGAPLGGRCSGCAEHASHGCYLRGAKHRALLSRASLMRVWGSLGVEGFTHFRGVYMVYGIGTELGGPSVLCQLRVGLPRFADMCQRFEGLVIHAMVQFAGGDPC